MEKNVTQPKSYISLREKISRLINGLTFNTALQCIETYIFYFYTDVLGITASLAGTIGIVCTSWDAINDPIIGSMVDNHRFKNGEKVRPILKYASIPFGIFVILMFFAPNLSMNGRFIYALITRFLFYIFMTYITVAITSTLYCSSNLREDRVSLGQYTTVGSMLGIAAASVLIWPLITFFGNLGSSYNEKTGFTCTISVFAIIAICGLLFLYSSSKERIKTINESNADKKLSIWICMKSFIKNKHWRGVVTLELLVFSCNTLVLTVLAYYCKYVLGDTSLTAVVMVAFLFGGIAVVPFLKLITKRFTSKGLGIACGIFFVISKLIFMAFPGTLGGIIAVAFVHGMGFGTKGTLSGVNYGYASDIMEYQMGRRVDGMIVVVGNLFSKILQAIIVFLIGLALDFTHYDGTLATQSKGTISVIYACIGWVGLIFAVLIVIVACRLNIEKEINRLREN